MKVKSTFFLFLIYLNSFIDIHTGFPRTMRYQKLDKTVLPNQKPDKTVWPIVDLSKENFSTEQKAQEMLANLSQERIENIVIFNDIDENFRKEAPNIFTKDQNIFYITMTLNLISALFDDQIIICTKSLFKNFKYLANIWSDLVILELAEFKDKYNNFLLNVTDAELQKLHAISKRLTEISFEVDKYFRFGQKKTDFPEAQDLLKDLSVHEKNFWDLFVCSKSDDILRQKNSYVLYEINNDYLLFLPKLKKNFIQPYSNLLGKVYLGLDLSSLRLISDNFISEIEYYDTILNYQVSDNFNLGVQLNDALKKTFVNKQEFKKNEYYSSQYLLPRFNIFINGHGSATDSFLGMNKSNIQPLLLLLNNHLWMKALILSSCYPGGKRYQEIFGNSLKDVGSFSEKLNYTIMTIGSFFSVTYSFWDYPGWFNYYEHLNKQFFKKLFNYLSLNKNEFLEALNFIKNELPYYQTSNYGSVKFPNTGWIMASDYGKEVVNITKTKVLSLKNQEIFPISNDKKIVLLNYSNISLTLKLEKKIDYSKFDEICKILPINYLYSNFFIQKLNFSLLNDSYSYFKNIFIVDIVSKIFNVKDLNIEEEKLILIDEVLVQEEDKEKRILYLAINYLSKTINFISEEKDELGEIKFYYKSYNVMTGILASQLADNMDSLRYLIVYNLLKNAIEENSNLSDKSNFIKKLENLPKSLDTAPEIVQESHTRKEIEDAIKEAILSKRLNIAALPFSPRPHTLKNKSHLNSPKRKVHNPYLMPKTEKEKVDKKENVVSVLSTFDSQVNPYQKGNLN